jgi:hypothetical protein
MVKKSGSRKVKKVGSRKAKKAGSRKAGSRKASSRKAGSRKAGSRKSKVMMGGACAINQHVWVDLNKAECTKKCQICGAVLTPPSC